MSSSYKKIKLNPENLKIAVKKELTEDEKIFRIIGLIFLAKIIFGLFLFFTQGEKSNNPLKRPRDGKTGNILSLNLFSIVF